MAGRSLSVMAPKLWNYLPLTLRTITSLSEFKSQLKAHHDMQLQSLLFLDWENIYCYHSQKCLMAHFNGCHEYSTCTPPPTCMHYNTQASVLTPFRNTPGSCCPSHPLLLAFCAPYDKIIVLCSSVEKLKLF